MSFVILIFKPDLTKIFCAAKISLNQLFPVRISKTRFINVNKNFPFVENFLHDAVVFLKLMHVDMARTKNNIKPREFRIYLRKIYRSIDRYQLIVAAMNNLDRAAHVF